MRTDSDMAGGISRFLGGSPIRVFIRLAILSLVVGFVLSWTGIYPRDIFEWFIDLGRWIYDQGFLFFADTLDYVLLGAAIVVPLFLIGRLLRIGRSRGD